MNSIEKLKKVQQEIDGKAEILLATKNQTVDILKEILRYQNFIFGENKVQEFLTKYEYLPAKWHFIGTLQTNKVKYIIDKVDCIQSVSSLRLLSEIDRQAKKHNLVMNVFFELNIANEASKTGASEAEFELMLSKVKEFSNVDLQGLMIMLPYNQNNDEFYLRAKQIYDKIKQKHNLQFLSMGMSGDYLQAIKHGSNMVRLGRLIFGDQDELVQQAVNKAEGS